MNWNHEEGVWSEIMETHLKPKEPENKNCRGWEAEVNRPLNCSAIEVLLEINLGFSV